MFFDILAARRIVFAYDIRLDARPLSVSLVTLEFVASQRGTRMTYAEQLAYLDGHEDRAQRGPARVGFLAAVKLLGPGVEPAPHLLQQV